MLEGARHDHVEPVIELREIPLDRLRSRLHEIAVDTIAAGVRGVHGFNAGRVESPGFMTRANEPDVGGTRVQAPAPNTQNTQYTMTRRKRRGRRSTVFRVRAGDCSTKPFRESCERILVMSGHGTSTAVNKVAARAACSGYTSYLSGCDAAVSITREAFRLPSGCLLAGITTLVPAVSFIDVGAITVTETPAGTVIV